MSRGPVSVRLVARLREQGLVPAGGPAVAVRTNASRSMKTAGAWAWCVMNPDTYAEYRVGSQFTMQQVMRAKAWDIGHGDYGDTDVDPSVADRTAWAAAQGLHGHCDSPA